jgi:hypothetical protein
MSERTTSSWRAKRRTFAAPKQHLEGVRTIGGVAIAKAISHQVELATTDRQAKPSSGTMRRSSQTPIERMMRQAEPSKLKAQFS